MNDLDDITTIRVTKKQRNNLKKFGNFLSDRRGGRFISQNDALAYLLNRLGEDDLADYKAWLFSEDINFKTRQELEEELQRERELGEGMFNMLCGSCQKHVAELMEELV